MKPEPVRILCIDGPRKPYPVVGIVNGEVLREWAADGHWLREDIIDGFQSCESPEDVVLAPTKHEGWIAIDRSGFVPRQYAQSDKSLISRGVADTLVPVTWEN